MLTFTARLRPIWSPNHPSAINKLPTEDNPLFVCIYCILSHYTCYSWVYTYCADKRSITSHSSLQLYLQEVAINMINLFVFSFSGVRQPYTWYSDKCNSVQSQPFWQSLCSDRAEPYGWCKSLNWCKHTKNYVKSTKIGLRHMFLTVCILTICIYPVMQLNFILGLPKLIQCNGSFKWLWTTPNPNDYKSSYEKIFCTGTDLRTTLQLDLC